MAKAKQYIKDEEARIEAIAILIEKKHVTTWAKIFDYIPRTVVATYLGTNNNRMKRLVDDPSTMTANEIAEVASYLRVDELVIAAFVLKARKAAKITAIKQGKAKR